MSQLSLRVISRLMAYPTATLQAAVPEMRSALIDEAALPSIHLEALDALLGTIAATPLLTLQERYVETFDRGRNLSLHLFEHVHGESRDRGQAMVDLMNHYHAHGCLLDAHELPDHLPLMLEFMSTQSREESRGLLEDAMPVLVLLGARLRESGGDYAALFEALESLGTAPAEAEAMRRQAAAEGPDETIERMDDIWEEEQVTFLGNSNPAGSGCTAQPAGPQVATEQPVQWMGRGSAKRGFLRA